MTAICKITNGVDSVNLIGGEFVIMDWRPAGVPFKGDGYWQDSAFAEGRRLARYTIGNIIETITLGQRGINQDAAIRQANKLASMLLDAADYSTKPKRGKRPIYIMVQASDETSPRYARIHAGMVGEYGNPFSQPFLQPDCAATVTDINLTIERTPWLELPPGQDVCQPITPTGNRIGDTTVTYKTYEDVLLNTGELSISAPATALWKLNETSGTTAVNYSSYGSLLDGTHSATNTLDELKFWRGVIPDPTTYIPITTGYVDIYSTDFNAVFNGNRGSIIAWCNTSGPVWSGGNAGYFIRLRRNASYSISIFHPASPDNSITWRYTTNGDQVSYTETDYSPQYTWFSVGMTWSQSEGRVRFYLDGALVSEQAIVEAWAGNLSATGTVIGASNNGGSDSIVSTMAYVGVWDQELTPEDYELIGVPRDDSKTIDFTAFDCDNIVAYTGNKRNFANLTHAFTWDNSLTTFSSNLIGSATPYGILPSTVQVDDALYLGIEQTADSGLPYGPFNSLVFDITTGASSSTLSYTGVWEYWNGSAWTGLANVVDATDGLQGPLEREGINPVFWNQPTNIVSRDVNGVTGYWVRMNVTAVGGTMTQPIVADQPYTIVKNYVEVPENATGGSLPAIARIELSQDGFSDIDRVVVGTKAVDVSPNFESHINISDIQNQGGVLVNEQHADASDVAALESATGRAINLTYSTGSATLTDIFTITLLPAISQSYTGSFKAFLIYKVVTALSDESTQFTYKVSVVGSTAPGTAIDTGTYLTSSNGFTVHEIGEIVIGPETFYGEVVGNIVFTWRSTISTGTDIDFYSLVLIPTDEWFGDFDGVPTGNFFTNAQHLSIDSTRYPDRAVVATVRNDGTDMNVGAFAQSHNGMATVKNDTTSRYHFLMMQYASGYESFPNYGGQVKMFRNRRYNYGRGDQ